MQASWSAAGVSIPRTTYDQWASLPHIPMSDLEPGDLILYNGESHVAIYIGDGYIHDLDQGKGEKTLTFIPELPKAGKYEVRLAYSPGSNRCDSVPVAILSADGEKVVSVERLAEGEEDEAAEG